jgi:hypothetical protein
MPLKGTAQAPHSPYSRTGPAVSLELGLWTLGHVTQNSHEGMHGFGNLEEVN